MQQTFKKNLTKNSKKYCNTIPFKDSSTGETLSLLGVANSGMLCSNIAFESIEDTQAPGLLRGHREETMIVSL